MTPHPLQEGLKIGHQHLLSLTVIVANKSPSFWHHIWSLLVWGSHLAPLPLCPSAIPSTPATQDYSPLLEHVMLSFIHKAAVLLSGSPPASSFQDSFTVSWPALQFQHQAQNGTNSRGPFNSCWIYICWIEFCLLMRKQSWDPWEVWGKQ